MELELRRESAAMVRSKGTNTNKREGKRGEGITLDRRPFCVFSRKG
jgi:hypothetical protein